MATTRSPSDRHTPSKLARGIRSIRSRTRRSFSAACSVRSPRAPASAADQTALRARCQVIWQSDFAAVCVALSERSRRDRSRRRRARAAGSTLRNTGQHVSAEIQTIRRLGSAKHATGAGGSRDKRDCEDSGAVPGLVSAGRPPTVSVAAVSRELEQSTATLLQFRRKHCDLRGKASEVPALKEQLKALVGVTGPDAALINAAHQAKAARAITSGSRIGELCRVP